MYSLIRLFPVRQLLVEQVPALTISLCMAELFYKFHSFILEGLAFMATWYALDAAIKLLGKSWRGTSNRS